MAPSNAPKAMPIDEDGDDRHVGHGREEGAGAEGDQPQHRADGQVDVPGDDQQGLPDRQNHR